MQLRAPFPTFHRITGVLCLLAAAGACTIEEPPRQDNVRGAAPSTLLIDADIPPAVAGDPGWSYSQAIEADLTGDGTNERVVLTAQVDMVRGRPAWDDGQAWQVYVEDGDRMRTHVYARRLQLGALTMRASAAEGNQRATIVLLEHLPDEIGLYEVVYESPGRIRVTQQFRRALDPRGDAASPRFP